MRRKFLLSMLIMSMLMLGMIITLASCKAKEKAPTPDSPDTSENTGNNDENNGDNSGDNNQGNTEDVSGEDTSKEFVVSFNTNCDDVIESQTVKAGEKLAAVATVTKEGHDFIGWYEDATFTKAFDLVDGTVNATMTLHAKWEKKSYSIRFDSLGGTEVDAQTVKYDELVSEPKAPTQLGYAFEGWCIDEECENRYDFGSKVTGNLKLYARWRELSKYDDLLQYEDTLVLNEDFNKYSENNTLPEFSGSWGTKGVYQTIDGKKTDGVLQEAKDPEKTKVQLGNWMAELIDLSEKNSSHLIVDFGSITGGIVEGYVEVTLIDQGDSWTFFQLFGANGSEVFGIRIDSKVFKYRLDGGTATAGNIAIPAANTQYAIYFKADLTSKKINVIVNGLEFVTDVTISQNGLAGFKLVSSDSNKKRMKIDNIVVVNENYTLEELQIKLKERLTAYKEANVNTYPNIASDLESKLEAGKTAIDAATNNEQAYAAFTAAKTQMDSAILAEYKNQKKLELETYVDVSKYTINQSSLQTAIAQGKSAIDNSKTTSEVSSAVVSAQAEIGKIQSDEQILDAAKKVAKDALTAYKAGQFTINANAYNSKVAEGKNAIDAATTQAVIELALTAAKAEIDKIKTDAEELQAKRLEAIDALTEYAATKKNQIASEEEADSYQEKIDAEKAAGIDLINSSNFDKIESILKSSKEKIDSLVAAASESFAEYKETTIEKLENYVASLNYQDSILVSNIADAKTAAITQMNAATTKNQIFDIYNQAIASIEGFISDYESSASNSILIQGQIVIKEFSGLSEAAYITFDKLASATDYVAYIKGVTYVSYTKVDNKLGYLRKIADTYRLDITGLAKGNYQVKIVPVISSIEEEASATTVKFGVEAYDRSGFAHFNYTEGVGAYKDDGTLKENAIVLYVTDENKNTVELTYGSITVKGIGNILNTVGQKCGEAGHENECKKTSSGKTYYGKGNENAGILKKLAEANIPLVVRFVGCVSDSGLYTKGAFAAGSTSLIEGLTAFDSNDYGGSEGDNGHMARIKSGKNITLEGIGENAVIDGWGFHFMASGEAPNLGKSFEVRNLIFINTPEDAIGMEGVQESAKTTSKLSASVERCWIHNNEFYCPNITGPAENDKSEGDGSVDFKRGQYFTCSYNYFEGCHKTNLVGSADSSLQFNLTYHHNYWKLCKARGPLARNANIHMYNNVFEGQTDYAMNTRADSYIFSEYNLFYMCKSPQRVDSGAIKSYNDSFSSCINLMQGTIVSEKDEYVPNSCQFIAAGVKYDKFDTDSTLSYIPTGDYYLQTNVTEARKVIEANTGVTKDHKIQAADVTLKDLSYVPANVTPKVIATYPSTETPGKISKTVYAFTINKTAEVTIVYASDDYATTGVLLNEAGECYMTAGGKIVLKPGTYIIQPTNFQPGDSKTVTTGVFKEMTITSISFVEYNSAEADQELIDNYNAVVGKIPATITYSSDCYNKINAAIEAYNALGDLKTNVDYTKVQNAYDTYVQLGKAYVENLIGSIGTVNQNSGAAISSARAAYTALIEQVKTVSISNYAVLVAAEAAFENYAVQSCIDKIDAIGTVTLDSEAAITLARNEYDALTKEQQAQITNYTILTAAEASYQNLVAVDNVNTLLANVNNSSMSSMKEAIDAYEALTASQKEMVNSEAISTVKVNYVIALIDAIGTVSSTSAGAIQTARDLYDSLNATQKSEVTNYSKLTAAEAAISEMLVEYTKSWTKSEGITDNTGTTKDGFSYKINGSVKDDGSVKIKKSSNNYFTLDNINSSSVTVKVTTKFDDTNNAGTGDIVVTFTDGTMKTYTFDVAEKKKSSEATIVIEEAGKVVKSISLVGSSSASSKNLALSSIIVTYKA